MNAAGHRKQKAEIYTPLAEQAVIPGKIGFRHQHTAQQHSDQCRPFSEFLMAVTDDLSDAENGDDSHEKRRLPGAEHLMERLREQTYHRFKEIQAVGRHERCQFENVERFGIGILFDSLMQGLVGKIIVIFPGPGDADGAHHAAVVTVVYTDNMVFGKIHRR